MTEEGQLLQASTPVRVLGLRSVPTVRQELLSVDNEAKAKYR